MLIAPNYVYKFTFKAALSVLDGVYRVVSLLSYRELVEGDVDLHVATYEPYGLTDEQFSSDLDAIRKGQILKLVSVTDPDRILYIPEILLDNLPDGGVQRYYQLGLAVDLGVYEDPEQLAEVRHEVEQLVASMTGHTNNSALYTVADAWLTQSEYQALATTRQVAVTRINNHYTDKLTLLKEIDRLKTVITYYEAALKH